MNNLIIAEQFHRLAKLMELHQENPFKIKAIANASSIIEKLHQDISEKNYLELENIKGIGKNILEKIHQILTYGQIKELEYYEKITPASVIDLLNIKGLGPSKVYKLWKEYNIENIDQLIQYAEQNKLNKIKGFTEKTQQQILENARFYLQSKNKLQLGIALHIAHTIQQDLAQHSIQTEVTGELRRHCEIITQLEFVTTKSVPEKLFHLIQNKTPVPIKFHVTDNVHFAKVLLETTGSKKFLDDINFYTISKKTYSSEKEIFEELQLPDIPPPQRESIEEYHYCDALTYVSYTIELKDIKGILHCHTTYSDGIHSLKEMADYCQEQKFQYLGICDHSQSAKYAGGLTSEKLIQQLEEIEKYNQLHNNFFIFKGIESDILKNGDLDYSSDILKQLDFVVASIHNHFDMTEKEATERIIKAIENPYTTILGHLTGRLLLIRKGYPVNIKKIIDACAANNVVIELNANTYRLDIDWRWLKYCAAKGVKIAINPDAHSKTAIHDILFGVMVAQKAGIEKEQVINTYSIEKIKSIFRKK